MKAWRRLINEVLYNKDSTDTKSCVPQFQLRERLRRLRARRN